MECTRLRTELSQGTVSRSGQALSGRAFARGLRLAGLGAVALLLLGCRLDMHIQPKYLPYEPTDFFADGRSERQPVPGTVARGQLRVDELFYTGKENGVVVDKFPFPITRADLDRGRERYNVYCTPCHDYTGSGRGMIVQRGFPQPPSYHIPRLREASVGTFLRGHHERIWGDVQLRSAHRAGGPVENRRVHSSSSAEPKRDRTGCAGIGSAEIDGAVRTTNTGAADRAIAMSSSDTSRPVIDRAQSRALAIGVVCFVAAIIWGSYCRSGLMRAVDALLPVVSFCLRVRRGNSPREPRIFDASPFDGRLVGSSDSADSRSEYSDDLGDGDFVYPDRAGNFAALSVVARR